MGVKPSVTTYRAPRTPTSPALKVAFRDAQPAPTGEPHLKPTECLASPGVTQRVASSGARAQHHSQEIVCQSVFRMKARAQA